jgi:hypothetical protein
MEKGDGPLWMAAFGISLVLNAVILALAGFAALQSATIRHTPPPPPAVEERVATIFAEMAKPAETPAATPENAAQRFARTSPDQLAEPVEKPAFMGERNTRATSDRAPDPAAAALPSQAGIEPRHEGEMETTQSDYQDGRLDAGEQAATPPTETATQAMAESAAAAESPPRQSAAEPVAKPGTDSERSLPPPREKLLEGPQPVDVQVPKNPETEENPKPTPEQRPAPEAMPTPAPPVEKPAVAETPRPTDPAFSGYQRKTAVVGSISRTGRSALDVEDSPMGRYQAAISRAVEQEWQRNCVRHRDFITPGFLTVRFFVEPTGKVRSVQFVGDMETGEVQKGFTLNSIRNAAIPAMPPALRKEHEKEPLELIFRFYF